jgi:membrane protein YdbS with pleckstrin-like domain
MVSDRAAACPRCGLAIAPAASTTSAPAGNPTGLPWPAAPPGREELVWEGGASPRLLAREPPGVLWAVVAPPLAIVLLPKALAIVAGMGRELRRAIAENGPTIRWVVVAAVFVLSAIRLARVALRYAQLKSTRYRLTNQRLTIESGLLAKRVDDVDLRSVQDVALEQSALERLLSVGRLSIVSSDHARPRLELMGIRDPRAVRERVRESAYQASQRQIFTRAT